MVVESNPLLSYYVRSIKANQIKDDNISPKGCATQKIKVVSKIYCDIHISVLKVSGRDYVERSLFDQK